MPSCSFLQSLRVSVSIARFFLFVRFVRPGQTKNERTDLERKSEIGVAGSGEKCANLLFAQ